MIVTMWKLLHCLVLKSDCAQPVLELLGSHAATGFSFSKTRLTAELNHNISQNVRVSFNISHRKPRRTEQRSPKRADACSLRFAWWMRGSVCFGPALMHFLISTSRSSSESLCWSPPLSVCLIELLVHFISTQTDSRTPPICPARCSRLQLGLNSPVRSKNVWTSKH